MHDRPDGCDITQPYQDYNTFASYETFDSQITHLQSLDQFYDPLGGFHPVGHNHIGFKCKPDDVPSEGSAMVYDVTSARDPVFYRWHGCLEELLQKFRDNEKCFFPPTLEDLVFEYDCLDECMK